MKDWKVGDVAYCHVDGCPWRAEWTTREATQAAVVWHVYHVHRPIWLRHAGDREPLDRQPETLGLRILR